ncbi:MAG: YceD family protein [Gaiellales bacterium]
MIDLSQLRLEPGAERSVEVPIAVPGIEIGGVEYAGPLSPPIARVDVTRLLSGLLMRLRLQTTISGPCHRCLETATVPVAIDAREYQADHPEPGAEAEEVCDYLQGDELDVATWAADAIVLSMPHKILCREDCQGLCPSCGTNLNTGTCQCPPPEPDERWGALRQLVDDDA